MNLRIAPYNINQYKFNFKSSQKPQNDNFEMSVGYVNDIHGSTNNMMRILSGIKGDLKVSAGDNYVGDEKNQAVHMATVEFLNLANIKATALGNHELDTTQKDCSDIIESYKGDILASNFNQELLENQDDEEIRNFNRTDLKKSLKKSAIVEVKGEKIGLVGAAPIDMFERATHPDYHTDCYVDELEDTIEDIQEEIDELKEKGVNKIFLLSHLGNKTDKIVAEQTDGIDVIIGGHTHELIRDIKEGENLLYSKSNEPVIITEAGKNGAYFGNLNLTFDKDGVITKAQNNIGNTRLFHKNMINQFIFNSILGKPEKIGYIKYAPEPVTCLIDENPHANFMCDAMRYELDADIALWNNSGTRDFFREGVIDSSDIKDIAPFADRVALADVPEKTLVNMFKRAVKESYKAQGHKPGLLAVSGLTYSVNSKKGILTGMTFIDKKGKEHKIDIDNPREDKTYKIAADSFMMSFGADYDILCPKGECVEFPYNKDFLACEYIKHLNRPILINQTGRIKFES